MKVTIEIEPSVSSYYVYGTPSHVAWYRSGTPSTPESKTIRSEREFSEYVNSGDDLEKVRKDLLDQIAEFAVQVAGDYIRVGRV